MQGVAMAANWLNTPNYRGLFLTWASTKSWSTSDFNLHNRCTGRSYLCVRCRTFGGNQSSGNQRMLLRCHMRGGRIDWTHLLQPALKWLWQLLAELVLQNQRMLLLHLAFAASDSRLILLASNWCLGRRGLAHFCSVCPPNWMPRWLQ